MSKSKTNYVKFLRIIPNVDILHNDFQMKVIHKLIVKSIKTCLSEFKKKIIFRKHKKPIMFFCGYVYASLNIFLI